MKKNEYICIYAVSFACNPSTAEDGMHIDLISAFATGGRVLSNWLIMYPLLYKTSTHNNYMQCGRSNRYPFNPLWITPFGVVGQLGDDSEYMLAFDTHYINT